jgi:pimeloyl-ACP methyl ester carboxylesterase
MRSFRRGAWIALAAGALAALVVPLVIPVTSSGTLTAAQAAPDGATLRDIDGLQVHYRFEPFSGQGDSAPLFVLLHGFGASTYSWREVMDDFAELGDVVAYDRPAFGFTERPTVWTGDSPYGVEAGKRLIASVIAEFQKPSQPVVLVDHSAGGTLAGEFALATPDALDALILVAPAISTTGGGAGWLSWLYRVPQIDRLGPVLVGGIATSGDELLEVSWHDVSLLTDDIRANYRRPLQVAGWERAFWEFQKAPRNFTINDRFEDLAVPVVIITGDDDRVVDTADSLALALRSPEAQLYVLQKSGHLPHEETPREFMGALREAMQRLS